VSPKSERSEVTFAFHFFRNLPAMCFPPPAQYVTSASAFLDGFPLRFYSSFSTVASSLIVHEDPSRPSPQRHEARYCRLQSYRIRRSRRPLLFRPRQRVLAFAPRERGHP